MLLTRSQLNRYIKKLIKESLTRTATINVDGQDILVLNSLERARGLVDLLLQSQEGGSAGFGNYFEKIVFDAFPGVYEELNDGGSVYPFADITEDKTGYNAMYTVKMKSVLDDSRIGGGKIVMSQIRSMLQHPTTISELSDKNLKIGFIGGSLEPSFFKKIKSIGIPIKITIIDPDDRSPTFKTSVDAGTGQRILSVDTSGIGDDYEYAKEFLGSGQPNPYINPKENQKSLIKTMLKADPKKRGVYEVNADDNIYNIDTNQYDIVNAPMARTYQNVLDQTLVAYDLNNSIIQNKKWIKDNPELNKLFNDMKKNIIKARESAANLLTEPFKPSDYTPGTVEKFKERFMKNTGIERPTIYLVVTGGFTSKEDIQKALTGDVPAPPNIQYLVDQIKNVLGYQSESAQAKGSGKDLAIRLTAILSKENMLAATKAMNSKYFPDGFFIRVTETQGYFFEPGSAINYPFDVLKNEKIKSSAKSYADYLKKSKEAELSLLDYQKQLELYNSKVIKKKPKKPSIPKEPKLSDEIPADFDFENFDFEEDHDLFVNIPEHELELANDEANKMLLKLAVQTLIGEINTLELTFSPNATPQDIQDFKDALVEFSSLREVSNLSQSSTIMTETQLNNLNQRIEDYRNKVVIPLSQKALPPNMNVRGQSLTKDQVMKRLGILKEFTAITSNVLSGADFSSLTRIPTPDNVLNMLFNLASLLTDIITVASYDINGMTKALIAGLNENKIYERILAELLKYSRR